MNQGTPEWMAARCGKVTASRVADVIAKTKTGYSTSRANYQAELLIERLTGQSPERFTNSTMQWGTDNEPAARDMYAFDSEQMVDLIGFVDHPTISMSGASPDGLVGDDGLVEIKCPMTATHLDALLTETIPDKYQVQMLWQMSATGRKWCDFVSFDPRLPASMRLFTKRFHRDDARIADLEAEVSTFLAELDKRIADLAAKGYGITPTFDDEQVMAAAQ